MKKVSFLSILLILISVSKSFSEEITYRKHIKPIFDAKCLSCHGQDSAPEYYAFKEDKDQWLQKGVGMRMDTYSHLIFYVGWPDTGSLMRRLDDGKNTKDGKPGNMYKYLGSTEEERQKNLEIFKKWVGNWFLKKWAEVTREELEEIKVRY